MSLHPGQYEFDWIGQEGNPEFFAFSTAGPGTGSIHLHAMNSTNIN